MLLAGLAADMADLGAVMLLTGAILAAITIVWNWLQSRWTAYQHGADRCACGLYDLTDINGQRTSVAIHRRDLCAPIREMLP